MKCPKCGRYQWNPAKDRLYCRRGCGAPLYVDDDGVTPLVHRVSPSTAAEMVLIVSAGGAGGTIFGGAMLDELMRHAARSDAAFSAHEADGMLVLDVRDACRVPPAPEPEPLADMLRCSLPKRISLPRSRRKHRS